MTTFDREFVLGQGLRATILATAEETGGRHDLSDTRQPPGEVTPLHLHTRYEERFWVASGSLTVGAGDEQVELSSGDYYRIGLNVPHTVRSGPDGAHALHISTPAGFAELIARTGLLWRHNRSWNTLNVRRFAHPARRSRIGPARLAH